MSKPTDDPLFPTMVVGSLPRPLWVQDVTKDRMCGRISEQDADALLDDAILSAIRMQERAGLDYISDGEWRRENYARVFADSVGGFRRQQVQRGSLTLHAFVVDQLQPRGPIVSPAAEFLRRHTKRKTIVALPSPCTIGDLMWHPVHSAAAYPTREAFVRACVPLLRAEVIALAGLGVDAVQLDEPLLPRLADPQTYGYHSLAELEAAAELSVQTINAVTEGFEGVFISVHLCHAHGEQYRITPGTGALIMDAVKRMQVDRFAMEFNSPVAQELQPLKAFPPDALLGLGVINPHNNGIETQETVVRRVERAMQFVEKERLTLNPDCGFATTATSTRKLDDVYARLSAMCQGARLLRATYG
jgi:5-methyltetrahydropteroyltriglutamate--homocysteine methyltransferase